MSTANGPTPPQIGGLLRLAWEELTADVAKRLEDAGFDGVRPVHYPILRDLLVGGHRPSELAARLGLSKQATNDVLREFEALGYVALEPDPGDGRAKRIVSTDRGRALWSATARASGDVGRRWARRVGRDRYAVFEEVLRQVAADRAGQRPGQVRG